ncbi:hypothetical protein LV779_36595 [Streptomyces thinghirensis]|nr:hypothetical protein [Streptomyces thinghirensis]
MGQVEVVQERLQAAVRRRAAHRHHPRRDPAPPPANWRSSPCPGSPTTRHRGPGRCRAARRRNRTSWARRASSRRGARHPSGRTAVPRRRAHPLRTRHPAGGRLRIRSGDAGEDMPAFFGWQAQDPSERAGWWPTASTP